MKQIVLFILLLAIVYGLSRVSQSALVRKVARGAVRCAAYLMALLSVVMAWLSFFSQEFGTFTMLVLAIVPAFAAWFINQLWRYSLSFEKPR